jgi:hypothetical protein
LALIAAFLQTFIAMGFAHCTRDVKTDSSQLLAYTKRRMAAGTESLKVRVFRYNLSSTLNEDI